MRIDVNDLRYQLLSRAGLRVPSVRYSGGYPWIPCVKLPANFSTNGNLVRLDDRCTDRELTALVMTTEQARKLNPGTTRPHRILLRCSACGKMIPAGRLLQHTHACEDTTSYDLHRYALGGV